MVKLRMIHSNMPHVNSYYIRRPRTKENTVGTRMVKDIVIVSMLIDACREAVEVCSLQGDVTQGDLRKLRSSIEKLNNVLRNNNIVPLQGNISHATPSKL